MVSSVHINTQVSSGSHKLLINVTRSRKREETSWESDNTRARERERENANVSAKEKGGYEGLAVQARHPHYHIISERERKEEDGEKKWERERDGERWRRFNLHWQSVSRAQSWLFKPASGVGRQRRREKGSGGRNRRLRYKIRGERGRKERDGQE